MKVLSLFSTQPAAGVRTRSRLFQFGWYLVGFTALLHTCLSAQISIEWDDNSSDETGFRIERATSGAFSPIGTVGANVVSYTDFTADQNVEYQYRVCAYNDAGDSAYTNIISNTPAFVTQPSTVGALTSGNDLLDDASFSVIVSGSPLPNVRWQVSTDSGATWTDLTDGGYYSGTSSSSLVITNARLSLNNLRYRAVASSSVGTATGNSVTLAVTGTDPVIPTPTEPTPTEPTPTIPTPTEPTPTEPTPSTPTTPTGGGGGGGGGGGISGTPPNISEQPSTSIVANVGETISISVVATGTPAPSYFWKKDGIELSDGNGIAGSRTNTLTISGATVDHAGTYFVTVSNGVQPNVTSTNAVLAVNKLPQSITFGALEPQSLATGSLDLTATASSGLPVTYTSSNPAVATIRRNTIVFQGAGTTTITASQSGDQKYLAAANVPQTIAISQAPTITQQPKSINLKAGASGTLAVTATGHPAPSYQWYKNGKPISGATASSLGFTNFQISDAGSYSVSLTNSGGVTESKTVVVGFISAGKASGSAYEVGSDIAHANGNRYDQVLLGGSAAAITADPGQVTRMSFIDLNDDIVQVEFSGAGTLSLVLAAASGPVLPEKYNQSIGYMRGHASIVIGGADQTTNVSVFSVGRSTAVNQALFRSDVAYDGVADIASIAISSTDGKFGGIRTANASYFAASGFTGIEAPEIQFAGPVYVGDISASDDATPVLRIGAAAEVRITGGDLLQANGQPLQISGITELRFTSGTTSHGTVLPAQTNRAQLEQDGRDITLQIAALPTP